MGNVDVNMTRLVQADTHRDAFAIARSLGMEALRDLADLMHMEPLPTRPKAAAVRVVVEARGLQLDGDDAAELYRQVGVRVPRALLTLAL